MQVFNAFYIVLDSNVIIASFASRGLCYDVFELCLSEHQIVISKALLREIARGLRKKIKLPKSLVKRIQDFLTSESEIAMAAKVPSDSCRDPGDLEILGIALVSRADVIVSGDEDLLALKVFRSIPVLSPREFWHFIQRRVRRSKGCQK